MIEFDVLDLADGTLVLAHSDDLAEVTHGGARPSRRSLAELRELRPSCRRSTRRSRTSAGADVALHVDVK